MMTRLKSPQKSSKAQKAAPLTGTAVQAFGQTVLLDHLDQVFEAQSQQEDLRHIYEPFLSSRVIPTSGLCVDLGAGAGWFALPFAKAFPNWHVLCLEPDPAAFAKLTANVARYELKNITCVQATLHPEATPAKLSARKSGDLALSKSLKSALKTHEDLPFQTLAALGASVAPICKDDDVAETETVSLPALPCNILAGLSPDLLRLNAPGCEGAIASELQAASVPFIVGRLYGHVPAHQFMPADDAGPREYYLRHGEHALRRDYEDNFTERQPHLDVVVAMYNTKTYILECIDSVLADDTPDVRLIVVDDGSTDGCGDLVAQTYQDNPRVTLVRKANGGCASARNYGRRMSTATHIAFIDADDRVDPGMFGALLDVARYTGASVVEGEFHTFVTHEDGSETATPSVENEHTTPGYHRLGDLNYDWLPSPEISIGQPTIWRRVHRRDFLDRKQIVFPEHVRAFDDQIFQLMVGHYAGAIAHVKGFDYHYRQHPAQDIKQGDERHFYSFNMFRSVFLRAIEEQWMDITPVCQSLINTMRWSYSGLRDDLKPIYTEAAAEFLAVVEKAFGVTFDAGQLAHTGIEGLAFLRDQQAKGLKQVKSAHGTLRLESWRWQPEFIRMMAQARSV